MHKLQSNNYEQKSLFEFYNYNEELHFKNLNKTIDDINQRYGKNTINWASAVIEKEWEPRRNKLSNLKTTNVEHIPTVFAN